MNRNIIFISICFTLLASCSNHKDESVVKDNKQTITHYNTVIAEKAGVSTIIKLPAQLAAFEEVSIFPKVNGYVKTVLVDIGSKVRKGMLLMVLEAPELEEAVAQAREKYARSRSDFSIDQEHYQRLLEASQTLGAISPFELSSVRAKVASDSALCNAEKANWQMQQTIMGYLKVTAPFNGVITERNVHPGALVSATAKDKPMLELKEQSHLRLEVDIPETMAVQFREKDSLSFFVSAYPGKKMTGMISRISENVNTQFRSERIEMDIWNSSGSLSPGMFADVILDARGNPDAFALPRSTVVSSTERKYVIVLRNGKIVKVDVTTGNENPQKIEVYGALHVGDSVIVNANDEIK